MLDSSVETIERAIAADAYRVCFPAICEARQLVLAEYSLGTMLSRYILHAEAHSGALPMGHMGAQMIRSRHLLMRHKPLSFLRYAAGKIYSRYYHTCRWRAYTGAKG